MKEKLLEKNASERLSILNKAIGLDTKANEAMSTEDTDLAELIVEEMSKNIIDKVTTDETIASNMNAPIRMKSDTYKLILEGNKPKFYYTEENANVPGVETPTSKNGFGNLKITAKKVSCQAYMSAELQEDSVIDQLSKLEDAIAKSFVEVIDDMILNGDVALTNNINAYGGTVPSQASYLVGDGLRKTGLVNAMTIDAGVLDLTDLRLARAKLGIKGTKISKLKWLVPIETYFKVLNLSQVETIEKFGSAATIVNGSLSMIDGIKIVITDAVGLVDANGYVNDTEASNVKGTIVLVHVDSVFVGIRRDMKMITEYLANYDQYRVNAHARIGITVMNDGVVVIKNITI